MHIWMHISHIVPLLRRNGLQILEVLASRHMTKHQNLVSDYWLQQNGEKTVIVDKSSQPVSGCGDVIIHAVKLGDVLHVLGVQRNLLSIYCITHTTKRVEFWRVWWVVKEMNGGFKVVYAGYCDESDHMYKLGKIRSVKQKGFPAMVANVDGWCHMLLLKMHVHFDEDIAAVTKKISTSNSANYGSVEDCTGQLAWNWYTLTCNARIWFEACTKIITLIWGQRFQLSTKAKIFSIDVYKDLRLRSESGTDPYLQFNWSVCQLPRKVGRIIAIAAYSQE